MKIIIILLLICCIPDKIAFSDEDTTQFYLNGIDEYFSNPIEIDNFELDGTYQDNHRIDYKDNNNKIYICTLYKRSKKELHRGPGKLLRIEDEIFEFIPMVSPGSPQLSLVGFKNELFIMISVGIEYDEKNEIKNSALELMRKLLLTI